MSRAHIAGRGAVCGFGAGRERLAAAVFGGESALRPRQRTAAFEAPTTVAAEVPGECLNGAAASGDLAFALAKTAAAEALAEAGNPDPGSIGLVLASTKADLSGVVGPGGGLGQPARLARRLVEALGLADVYGAVSCACASGLVALALAERRIRRGEAERILVLGVDSLCHFILAGFGALGALDPAACRPFDATRRGISLGDGAAALLLSGHGSESLGVVLAGHGGANDACHVTGPDLQGQGLALAVVRALARAGIEPGDVDMVHLHGTGTIANDRSEALGLAHAFGGRTPPAFGTKAQTGHTLGAAGVLETVLAVEALQRALAPANIGLQEIGVDAELDLVREPRSLTRSRCALKVASGFGGVQAAMVLCT